MKKFYTLMLAAATTLMASAAMPQLTGKYSDGLAAGKYDRMERTKPHLSRAEGIDINVYEDVITEPEGQKTKYLMKSLNFQLDFMGGLVLANQELEAVIVWGENGSVYIKDIMFGLPDTGVYVEGELNPSDVEGVTGTITVELPQVCSAIDMGDDGMYYPMASLMELSLDKNDYVVAANIDADNNVVYYDLYDDGTVKLRLNDGDPTDPSVLPHYIVGLIDEYTPGEDTWLGYGTAYAEYSAFPYELNTLPADIELDTWAILSNSGNKIIEVGFTDDTFYMTGFSQLVPEAVAVGKINGDKIEMDFPQYLGADDGMLLFFQGVEWDSEMFMTPSPMDHLTLNYDAAGKRISVDNPLVDIGVGVGGERDALWEYYENAVITWLDPEKVNANPQLPTVAYYTPCEYRDWNGSYEGYIEWVIPTVNVNEQPLDPEYMYYNLYVDGELWTLTVEDYPGFDEDVTDIPYYFEDGYDLQVLEESHYLTFKFDGAKTFGCQSYFRGTDGKTYRSGMVTYDVETGECGINSVEIADKDIKSVELYNLQGQRVNNARGVILHKITFADGTVKTIKTIKK